MPFLDLEEALDELRVGAVDFSTPIDPNRVVSNSYERALLRDSFIIRRYNPREPRSEEQRKEARKAFERSEHRRAYARQWMRDHYVPTGRPRGPRPKIMGDRSMKVTAFLREIRKYGLTGSVKFICYGRDLPETTEGIEQLLAAATPAAEAARVDLVVQLFVGKAWGTKRIAKLLEMTPDDVVAGLRARNYFVPSDA